MTVAAAEQDVGLNTDGPQFLDAVLRGFGFQFLRGGNPRHQRDMDEERIPRPSSCRNWRMASRNGSDSISPTVPPISTITTSMGDRPAPRRVSRRP